MRYPSSGRRNLVLALAAIMIGAGATACTSSLPPSSDGAVNAFLAGWRTGAFAPSLPFVDANGGTLAGTVVMTDLQALSGDLAAMRPTLAAAKAKVGKSTATAALTVTWPITATNPWTYQSTLRLSQKGRTWQILWSPDVVEPDLTAGATLRIRSVAATRGDILDGTGAAIVSARQTVTVGVQPSQVTDIDSLIASLTSALTSVHVDVDLKDLPDRVRKAAPDAFVEIVALRRDVYQQIRSQIHDLDGTVFREGTRPLAPSRTFAHALLGEVDDITREQLDANPGRYQVGDQIGTGGIQGAYEDRLRGTPALSVVIPGRGKASDGTDNPDKTLFHVDPIPGQAVKTSLDVATQNAADAAIASEPLPSAIVAIRISDGAIIAVANGPGATGQDLAMDARVPPGSTFKTVTAANLLESGAATLTTVVPCPKTLNVGGRIFTNHEGEVPGSNTLLIDFAQSCNTAFASLAPKLGPNGLATMAAQLGIGVKWTTGVPTFTGSVPPDGTDIDQAAAAFGQGKTLVSPIALASAAAALARGHWIAPTVVSDPAVTNPVPGTPLKQSTVDSLKTMMRAVITSGTAPSLAKVPGAPVYVKTGTAEFDDNPDHTHSWIMGYRGDLAFAIFIQGGGLSTAKAVPIARTFLTALK